MTFTFALYTYFPHGGLTRDLLAIARACQLRDHRVQVYAARCRGTAPADLSLRLLPVRAVTNHGKNRAFAARLAQVVAGAAPNLLVGFNKMPGIDVYYAADGCFADKTAAHRWRRLSPRYRQFLADERAVFCPSSPTRMLMIARNQMRIYRHIYATDAARMTLLPPGIDRSRVAGADAPSRRQRFRAHWQLDEDDKLLLALGSGFRTKGLDRTLRALAALPSPWLEKTRLMVVGADKTAAFEKIARRLGVAARVQFLGGRDDAADFLLGADLLMHPARHENTGTVLLEAMVAGLPVLATAACGYAHYVRDEKMGAVLAAPFCQGDLDASALRLLARPRQQWRTRGQNFANTADIYDLPARASRHLEAIAGQVAQQSARLDARRPTCPPAP